MSFEEEEESSELNCTLWVGNLDSQVNENTLLELFTQVGPIEKVHIPKGKDGVGHKGYCFIQFQHDDSVPYTMNVMEGTSLYGKLLRLQPRPGSKHRKLMDQRENEQRQLQLAQHQHPHPQQHQQPQPQQWFVAPPQMGGFQGMLVYPNHPQMYHHQPYGGAGVGVANGIPLQFSPGMGLPMIQIPIAAQPPPHEVQQQQHVRLPRNPEFRQPRPPRPSMTNGYGGAHRSPGPTAQPSHYSNSAAANNTHSATQVLNGSQPRFTHSNSGTRGARPNNPHRPPHSNNYLQNGPRNGNNNNGNGRLPFSNSPRASYAAAQAPQIYATPLYHSPQPGPYNTQGGVQYQNEPQFYRRQQQPHGQLPHPAAGIVAFPAANGANMYQQQQQY